MLTGIEEGQTFSVPFFFFNLIFFKIIFKIIKKIDGFLKKLLFFAFAPL